MLDEAFPLPAICVFLQSVQAPSSLLDALEQHLNSLENTKKSGVTFVVPSK